MRRPAAAAISTAARAAALSAAAAAPAWSEVLGRADTAGPLVGAAGAAAAVSAGCDDLCDHAWRNPTAIAAALSAASTR